MRQKVLLTGGSGLLGLNWALAVRDRFSVMLGLHHHKVNMRGVECQELNLELAEQFRFALQNIKPDIVIHAAGLTSVERCEADPSLAHHVNTELTETVAQACADLNVRLVHISTDHLFRGDQQFLVETYPVDPINVYAFTKREAEEKVIKIFPEALVIRTNFFGWGPSYRQSFSDMIIGSLRSGRELTLFQDVHYTPILAESLVLAVHDLVEQKANGIVNVTGDERISKYEFGLILADRFGLDSRLIKPGLIADQPNLVQRPKDMSLSNQKACTLLGRQLGTTHEHIDRLWQQEASGLTQEIKKL